MNRLKFAEDWDKLSKPRFTTIRSWRPEKEAYYRSAVGSEFSMIRVPTYWSFRGHKIGSATLKSVRVIVPKELPAETLIEDVRRAGKPVQVWMDRLLAMDKALLLEFENHTGILGAR